MTTTGQISFDDFVALSIRLRSLSGSSLHQLLVCSTDFNVPQQLVSALFRTRDTAGQGYATIYFDDFIQMTMST